MKALKVPLKDAQLVKKKLVELDLFLKGYKYVKEEEFIYYPVKEGLKGFELADKDFKPSKKIPDLKKSLENELSKQELELLKTAFDVVGDIAILEIDDELREREVIIAKALLDSNKNIKTVLRKNDKHQGEFRTQEMKYLAGVDTRKTIHKEHGCKIMVDVEKVYFSPRLSNERLRIANLVKKGESVLVLFSGCAPYPVVIAKNSNPSKILAVEHNPVGHEFAKINVKLNKLNNVELLYEDAGSISEKFDRVVMPAPDNAFDFLDKIPSFSKRFVHLYTFARVEEFSELENKIKSKLNSSKNFKFFKCGSHAPGVFRICIDFEI
jgi:tRNA (guanine37-N1)-methyltransferase